MCLPVYRMIILTVCLSGRALLSAAALYVPPGVDRVASEPSHGLRIRLTNGERETMDIMIDAIRFV